MDFAVQYADVIATPNRALFLEVLASVSPTGMLGMVGPRNSLHKSYLEWSNLEVDALIETEKQWFKQWIAEFDQQEFTEALLSFTLQPPGIQEQLRILPSGVTDFEYQIPIWWEILAKNNAPNLVKLFLAHSPAPIMDVHLHFLKDCIAAIVPAEWEVEMKGFLAKKGRLEEEENGMDWVANEYRWLYENQREIQGLFSPGTLGQAYQTLLMMYLPDLLDFDEANRKKVKKIDDKIVSKGVWSKIRNWISPRRPRG